MTKNHNKIIKYDEIDGISVYLWANNELELEFEHDNLNVTVKIPSEALKEFLGIKP